MTQLAQPLAGCTILITADRRKRELAAALERRGARVQFAPAVSTVPHLDDAQLIADTRALIANPPDVVVATTGVGFRGWIEAADAAGLAEPLLEVMGQARIVARGPKARGAVQQNGLEVHWVATSEMAAEVQDFLLGEGVAGLHIAVQHHGTGSDGLDDAFRQAGATVQSLVIYGSGPPLDPELHQRGIAHVAAGHIDAVVFTSAPGSQAWVDGVKEAGALAAVRELAATGELVLASVGPVTSAPLVAAGLPARHPDRWRLGAMVRELAIDFGAASAAIPTPDGPLVMRAASAVLDGKVLDLTPTGLALLRALVVAGGNVLTREQLSEVLPGNGAGTHAVEAAINRLRESTGSPRLVRTVVKRGYALAVAP